MKASLAMPNQRVNLSVRSVTGLANDARPAPAWPAGYAQRWAESAVTPEEASRHGTHFGSGRRMLGRGRVNDSF